MGQKRRALYALAASFSLLSCVSVTEMAENDPTGCLQLIEPAILFREWNPAADLQMPWFGKYALRPISLADKCLPQSKEEYDRDPERWKAAPGHAAWQRPKLHGTIGGLAKCSYEVVAILDAGTRIRITEVTSDWTPDFGWRQNVDARLYSDLALGKRVRLRNMFLVPAANELRPIDTFVRFCDVTPSR